MFLQKKRVKFFWFTFIAIFIWEWFPEYIAPSVSYRRGMVVFSDSQVSYSTLTGVSIFCLAVRDSA